MSQLPSCSVVIDIVLRGDPQTLLIHLLCCNKITVAFSKDSFCVDCFCSLMKNPFDTFHTGIAGRVRRINPGSFLIECKGFLQFSSIFGLLCFFEEWLSLETNCRLTVSNHLFG